MSEYRLSRSPEELRAWLSTLHEAIRSAATESLAGGAAHAITRQSAADTIFALDQHVDDVLVAFFNDHARTLPMVVVAEGLSVADGRFGDDVALFGCGTPSDAEIILLLDPVDGTRGLMFDKRPAWMLAGVSRGGAWPGRLQDIDFAFMGELPTSKQGKIDQWWASRGQGAQGQRIDLSSSTSSAIRPTPSPDVSLESGFAQIAKFFPAAKSILVDLETRLFAGLGLSDSARVFDDQYISTGGQLAELMLGHDRFTADLRGWAFARLGRDQGLCCHPYDLAAVLVAEEAGIIVTDAAGRPLDAPIDVTTGVDWIAYANRALRGQIEPALLALLGGEAANWA